jgi:hypothetical protein
MSYRPPRLLVAPALAVAVILAAGAPAQDQANDAPQGTIILDTAGYWRSFASIAPPVVRDEPGAEPRVLETLATWLNDPTPGPAKNWSAVDFDDTGWCRMPGVPFTGAKHTSPFIRTLYVRGRFTVTDPAAADDLQLSLTYHGGVVVYINGRELARRHLPEGPLGVETLASDYAKGDEPLRALDGLAVPGAMLRKGQNVLAVQVFRAAYRPEDRITNRRARTIVDWGSCLLGGIRLISRGGAGVESNVARPVGLQVWNADMLLMDSDLDWGDPHEPLGPMRLVGARNGGFTAKVVVGSDQPIQSLRVTASPLRGPGGAVIPAERLELRYGLPGARIDSMYQRYLAEPGFFDAMAERAPEEVPVRKKVVRRGWGNIQSPGVAPSYGAVVPVYLTVQVPADTAAGDYQGVLTIAAEGEQPTRVAVSLKVCDWTLPDPVDYHTFGDVVQSPESVALQYEVGLWSDEHWRLLERSMKQLGRAGAKVVYLPLICHTNVGNSETMVRWKPKAGGYEHDFLIAERYLDLFLKHVGKPTVVCLYVSDYNTIRDAKPVGRTDTKARAVDNAFVPVTAVGPDGEPTLLKLPPYSDPKARALWKPVIDGLRKRLADRGLDDAMMFGISADFIASPETVEMFRVIAPATPWVAACHPFLEKIQDAPCGYSAGVWGANSLGYEGTSHYGWRREQLSVQFPRSTTMDFHAMTFRGMAEASSGGTTRGFARLGADFWPVLKDGRGRRAGTLSARYPDTSWRNLDVRTCLLSPGSEGAIGTTRFEMLREGLQEAEARIFIERALLDEASRAKLGEARAKRYAQMLAERTQYLRIGMSTLTWVNIYWYYCADGDNNWWMASPVYGTQWYAATDWQSRSQTLYQAAGEVADILER